MKDRAWYLVCYDIRDDKRLRGVAHLLKGYGERLQYSVFRCHLTPREEERMRWELTRIVVKEDAWLIIPLGENSLRRIRGRGNGATWQIDRPSFVIL